MKQLWPAVVVLLGTSCATAVDEFGPGTAPHDASVKDSPTDQGTPDTSSAPDSGTTPDSVVKDSSVDPDTGDPDTGDPDTGDPDTGDPDTGTPDTGSPPSDGGIGAGCTKCSGACPPLAESFCVLSCALSGKTKCFMDLAGTCTCL